VINYSCTGLCGVRFPAYLTTEVAIWAPIDVDVMKRKVAVLLSLLGELDIPVRASQMITEPLQFLCP